MIGGYERDSEREPSPAPPAHGYVTTFQGVISIIVGIGTLLGILGGGLQKFDALEQRVAKTEYQAQISIDDRKELHTTMGQQADNYNQINSRLARIETKLDNLQQKH